MSNEKDEKNKSTPSGLTEEPFSITLGEPAKGPEDSDIGTIFVNKEYRIRRFVSTITELINVDTFNVNYDLEDFTRRLEYDDIKEDIDNVLNNNMRLTREVREKSGRWYMIELRPYLTKDEVEGVVITFVDVTELQQTKEVLAKKVEEIKELQRAVSKTDVNQRWYIGQYLHDEVAQSLLSASFLATNIKDELDKREKNLMKKMEDLIDIINQNVEAVRDLSHEVIPVNQEEERGINDAFHKLAKQLEKVHNIHCEIEYDSTIDAIKNKEIATHLYRITEEAAHNAAAHGKAENIRITLKSNNNHLYLNIEDDGTGFTDSSKEEGGMGISIMRYRMELIGGTLEILDTSDLGDKGTTISCKLPIEKL